MIDEALDKACEFIADRTGSCPLDALEMEPWLPASCEDVCNVPPDSTGPCWKVFFVGAVIGSLVTHLPQFADELENP